MDIWLREAYKKIEEMPTSALRIREAAYNDLFFFAKLVNPGYSYGSIHRDLFRWLQDYSLYGIDEVEVNNKLLMLPRAHLKSHMVATAVAWYILRHPEVTILYLSATAELAQVQLFDIKNILGGDVFMKYWPDYVHPEVGKRSKWSSTKIIIDHPKRKKEGVRDATIATAGLTTNTTGWHADIIAADDLVVPENAYTEEGRELVSKKTSQFTSIRNTGGFTLACGTRYHPSDQYRKMKEAEYVSYDEAGVEQGKMPVWSIKEHPVEVEGHFLWPRTVRSDGKAFGFDKQSLARIEAEYDDRVQFYAQYYNNPNDPGSERLNRDDFQYFNPKYLEGGGGSWTYNGNKLNIYAAVDFAYSLNKNADYTAIVVIGIDADGNIYVLDIDRFKSTKNIEYFNHIVSLHNKWNFKKLSAEVVAAQKTIVEAIKDFVRDKGMRLKVEEFRPTKEQGSKEQRIAAILEHRYSNLEIWHREGGWTEVLEDELVLARPPHDDIKDALANAVAISVKPTRSMVSAMSDFMGSSNKSRFGGYNV